MSHLLQERFFTIELSCPLLFSRIEVIIADTFLHVQPFDVTCVGNLPITLPPNDEIRCCPQLSGSS